MRASPGDPRLQPGRRRLLQLGAALRLAPAAWLAACGRRAGPRRRRLLAGAPGRSGLAGRGALEGAGGGRRRLAARPAVAVRRLPRRRIGAGLHATLHLGVESLRHERRPGADADLRLGRCLGLAGERLRGRGAAHRRRRCRGQLRPHPSAAAGGQGRRAQLPGHVERRRFAAGLDPQDVDGDAARRLRAAGLRRPGCAGARRLGRRRRALVAGLRRGHDERRRLRPGRRLHDGGRRRAGAERRLRQLLQGLRAGLRQPAGSRGGDRRRRGAHRQRLQRARAVLGPEGRRRRQPRHRHPADLARASPARGLRRREPDGAGGVAARPFAGSSA